MFDATVEGDGEMLNMGGWVDGGFFGVGEIAGCTVLSSEAADPSGAMRIACGAWMAFESV